MMLDYMLVRKMAFKFELENLHINTHISLRFFFGLVILAPVNSQIAVMPKTPKGRKTYLVRPSQVVG
jgi:hypothetical protein